MCIMYYTLLPEIFVQIYWMYLGRNQDIYGGDGGEAKLTCRGANEIIYKNILVTNQIIISI